MIKLHDDTRSHAPAMTINALTALLKQGDIGQIYNKVVFNTCTNGLPMITEFTRTDYDVSVSVEFWGMAEEDVQTFVKLNEKNRWETSVEELRNIAEEYSWFANFTIGDNGKIYDVEINQLYNDDGFKFPTVYF